MQDNNPYLPATLETEMKEAYVDYAMSVIVSRALPDVRDGLKPVHRRILYTMLEEGITPDKSFRKSAATVGNVLAKYHPHGDSSVYDAMVRLAQKFNMRYPLVSPQGNFGSMDGDKAAAMRYTEARLSKLAMEMVGDLNKDTVDWRPNFDNTTQEPCVLPAMFPNLLVNGSEGIAVGMATKILPHNLTEVLNGTLALLDKPQISVDELMRYIPGPDFPTGANILGQAGIRKAYREGRGTIVVRSTVETEEIGKGRYALVVTEIPYQVNKAAMLQKIGKMVNEKKIEGISDIRDESSKTVRIVFELKSKAVPEVVMNHLFKNTELQVNLGINTLALVDNMPRTLSLKEILQYFLEHRREVVRRRTQFELDKSLARDHIVEGLIKALDFIDEIIRIIRSSSDTDSARTALMERFEFTDIQAQAILDMTLKRLTGLEYQKLADEHGRLLKKIDRCQKILADQVVMDGVIRGELLDVRDHSRRFLDPAIFPNGDERRTKIIPYADSSIDMEDLLPDDPAVLTLSHSGYIKRMSPAFYQVQSRNGRGKVGAALKDEDEIIGLVSSSLHQHLLLITNKGRVYHKRVFDIPDSSRTSKGTAVINILPLMDGECVQSILALPSLKEEGSILMVTRKGRIKRTLLSAFANIRSAGIIAIGLMEGDEVVDAKFSSYTGVDSEEYQQDGDEEADVSGADEESDAAEEDSDIPEDEDNALDGSEDEKLYPRSLGGVMIFTRLGRCLRFAEDKLRPMGRTGRGIMGIKLAENDSVIAVDVASNGEYVLTVSEYGFGKRTPIDRYSIKGRNGRGIFATGCNDKSGAIVGALLSDDDGKELMITTQQGVFIRFRMEEVRITAGRNSVGVKFMKLQPGDKVVDVALVEPQSDEDVIYDHDESISELDDLVRARTYTPHEGTVIAPGDDEADLPSYLLNHGLARLERVNEVLGENADPDPDELAAFADYAIRAAAQDAREAAERVKDIAPTEEAGEAPQGDR